MNKLISKRKEKPVGTTAARWCFYLSGLLILAMGLTLNTKAGLGVSPIISLSYAASVIWERNFGDMTFILYGIFVLVQAVIHLRIKGEAGRSLLIKDILQFPLSIIFTRFLNVFSACIPPLDSLGAAASGLPGRLGVLALADCFGLGTGLMKNCVDASCIVLSLTMGMLFAGKPVGIGIGTVCAVILVGRVIALFHRIFGKTMLHAAGLEK